jgi:hypothetical protein
VRAQQKSIRVREIAVQFERQNKTKKEKAIPVIEEEINHL